MIPSSVLGMIKKEGEGPVEWKPEAEIDARSCETSKSAHFDPWYETRILGPFCSV
jgi:hypothetical protein